MITSIKGSPQEYGVDESKLRPFEKLLQNLEGVLMEGKIFEVSMEICITLRGPECSRIILLID